MESNIFKFFSSFLVTVPVALLGALVLSSCSGEERVAPLPVELPDPPPEARLLDVAGVGPHVTTMVLGTSQAAGTSASLEALFEVTGTGPESLIDYYGDWLTGHGWEQSSEPIELNGAPAARWEGEDQRVVITVVTLQDRDIALVLSSTEKF